MGDCQLRFSNGGVGQADQRAGGAANACWPGRSGGACRSREELSSGARGFVPTCYYDQYAAPAPATTLEGIVTDVNDHNIADERFT